MNHFWILLLLFVGVGMAEEDKILVSTYTADVVYVSTESMLAFNDIQPTYSIVFYDKDREIGGISWKTGELVFTGKASESAKVFFDYFLKGLVDEYIKNNCGNIPPKDSQKK